MLFFLLLLGQTCARTVKNLPEFRLVKTKFFFRPYDNCEQEIIKLINSAKREILILAYSFNNLNILNALNSMAKRGVKIIVVCDKSQFQKKSPKENLLPQISIYMAKPKNNGIAHNKIIIIDRKFVLTGSYNFSRSTEEKNNENIVIMESELIAKEYLANWTDLWEQSLSQ